MRAPAFLLIVLGLSYAQARADEPEQAQSALPLRGAECLDPTQARGWTEIDDRLLLVDAGRRKYRIEVIPSCTALGYTGTIGFRGDPVSGQVCGGLNDAVLTRDYPCHIQRIELLSKEQYQQALKEHSEARKAGRTEKADDAETEEVESAEDANEAQTPEADSNAS